MWNEKEISHWSLSAFMIYFHLMNTKYDVSAVLSVSGVQNSKNDKNGLIYWNINQSNLTDLISSIYIT